MSAARFCPSVPLPAVAFVPGRAGSKRPADGWLSIHARTLSPDRWRENEAWLYGVDLWNTGFLWEAHEAWESIWRAPYDAEQAEFLRGMIQCAAAWLKLAIGNTNSARSLSNAGLSRLATVQSLTNGRYLGLEVRSFSAAFEARIEEGPGATIQVPLLALA